MKEIRKVNFKREWTIASKQGLREIKQSYRTTNKRAAYKLCNFVNGKRRGGSRNYVVKRVQDVNA